MEVLQVGYLHAVAAAARCQLSQPQPDRGLDWTITHEAASHVHDSEALLKVQLKSTYQRLPVSDETSFPFQLANEHLAKLARSPVTIPRILIVMIVPRDIRDWVFSRPTEMLVRHQAYWVNLEGVQPTGTKKTTVRVHTDHVFDDIALCKVMELIGQGGVPK
jgi:hypothetical protein